MINFSNEHNKKILITLTKLLSDLDAIKNSAATDQAKVREMLKTVYGANDIASLQIGKIIQQMRTDHPVQVMEIAQSSGMIGDETILEKVMHY